ncbi:MAG: four-carbon acid sugar kinase family protein [Mesorhizobium sp.]|nr:MAG: four-carbon acid sugar kinase family protein [Mesorhizobium sp.]
MLLGIIADDFTGASDIANTVAKGLPGQGGLRTVQFLGVPSEDAEADVEAGVVSLTSRSIPPADAIRQSLAALGWLQAQGCEQFVFKYCSTFDSTPDGNIGPVAEALAKALSTKGVVVCPAFPTAGRTIYQGHLFVGNRLLNESGMQHHPLNPMTDPDIRRWLARQSAYPVGNVAWPIVQAGAAAIAEELQKACAKGETLVVVDAISDDDLVTIGLAVKDRCLLTGGSGIALGLPGNFIAAGKAAGALPTRTRIDGPEAILAGSCSGATLEQVSVHAETHPTLAVDVDAVMEGGFTENEIVRFALDNAGRAPLAYSSSTPEQVRATQQRHGGDVVARKLDALFANAARMLVQGGIRKLVVAGGETSGAVVSALDIDRLTIGEEIDPGVPLLTANAPAPMALALKSGNFGSRDFFAKALERMADDDQRK